MYIYHERRVEMNLKTRKAIEDFMKGYRRKVADLKESGEMSMFEGKRALSVQGYRLLCKISIMTKRVLLVLVFHFLHFAYLSKM
jgi:hypothetical protein